MPPGRAAGKHNKAPSSSATRRVIFAKCVDGANRGEKCSQAKPNLVKASGGEGISIIHGANCRRASSQSQDPALRVQMRFLKLLQTDP